MVTGTVHAEDGCGVQDVVGRAEGRKEGGREGERVVDKKICLILCPHRYRIPTPSTSQRAQGGEGEREGGKKGGKDDETHRMRASATSKSSKGVTSPFFKASMTWPGEGGGRRVGGKVDCL